MLTQLPIRHGERAVCLFLIAHTDKILGGMYRPTDQFVPIGFPIRGTYNDYGIIEKIDDTPAAQITFEYLQYALKKGIIKNITPEHDIDQYKANSLDDLCRLTEREYLEGMNGQIICSALIHERAFDIVIYDVKGRTPFMGKHPYGEYLVQAAEKWLADKGWGNLLERFGRSKYLNSFLRDFSEVLYDGDYFLDRINKEQRKDLIPALTDILAFDLSLSYLRKTFAPQSGKGSQQTEMHLHALIASFVDQHALNAMEEWVKENVDDGEFYPYKEYPQVSLDDEEGKE